MRKNVLEYLESSARMHADKPAFCDENRVFTFGELLKAAQGLGTHLAKTVDTLHKPVAVLIGRTAESVAAMQGVLYDAAMGDVPLQGNAAWLLRHTLNSAKAVVDALIEGCDEAF